MKPELSKGVFRTRLKYSQFLTFYFLVLILWTSVCCCGFGAGEMAFTTEARERIDFKPLHEGKNYAWNLIEPTAQVSKKFDLSLPHQKIGAPILRAYNDNEAKGTLHNLSPKPRIVLSHPAPIIKKSRSPNSSLNKAVISDKRNTELPRIIRSSSASLEKKRPMFLSDAEQKILSPKIPKPALAPLDGDSDWKQRLTEAQNKYSNYASVHQDENRELKESYNGEKDDLGSKQELNQGLKKNFLRTDSSVARKIREPLSPRDTFVNFQDDSLKKEIKKIPFTKLPKKSGQDSHLRLSSIKDISERNKGEILEEVSPKPLGKSLDSNSRPNLNDDDDDDYDDFKIDLEETSVILDRIKRNLQAAVDTDDFDFEDSPRKTLEFDQDITKNTGQ
ncbi:expressed protein, partial [Phakopsora pachyrhizi]